jgi:hypothetical protein
MLNQSVPPAPQKGNTMPLLLILLLGIGSALAEELPGKSPISSGISHSSPESPNRPPSDLANGQPWTTNPSTVELARQPSVGGRDSLGGDPTRPGHQGSESGGR